METMKTIKPTPAVVQIEKGKLRQLLHQEEERIASDIELPKPKAKRFTAADLWHCRRQNRFLGLSIR